MKRRATLFLIIATIVAATFGCREKQTKLEVIELGGEFTMTDQNGGDFRFSELRGKTVLLFFGYTHCPDACPNTFSKIGSAYKKLGKRAENLETVFISVDRERDTTKKINEYISYFKYNPIGLTGTKEELQHVADLFKIVYTKRMTDSELGYQMDHSTTIFVIDKEGRTRYLFGQTDRAENLASILNFLMDEE